MNCELQKGRGKYPGSRAGQESGGVAVCKLMGQEAGNQELRP